MPHRVRVGGDLFHPVVPYGAVYVGRAGPYLKASKWANPYSVRGMGRTLALIQYCHLVRDHHEQIKAELSGKDLACWCHLDEECHADILLDIANGSDNERSVDTGSLRAASGNHD